MFGRKKELVRITMDGTKYRIKLSGSTVRMLEGMLKALAEILSRAKKSGMTKEEVAEGVKELLLDEMKELEAQTHGH